ncbi:MAG: substrate-binding domain-containing protein [Phycisphaerae bacterium]
MVTAVAAPAVREPRRRVLVSLSWFSMAIQRGIGRYAERAHWDLDLSSVHDSLVPLRWDGDGILCTSGNEPTLDKRIVSYHKPIVNIGNDATFPAPRVMADVKQVVHLALEHFIERGFEHLAYYVCVGNRAETEKLRVFQNAVAEIGKTLHVIDCSGNPYNRRIQQLGQRLSELPKPLAINAQVDEFAIEVIQAALEAGLRVPQDVAVLGCDDDPLICASAPVPLSSVDNNLEGIGYTAAELLDRMMRGEKISTKLVLVPPRGVITRQSTDILAIPDADVAAAIKIIHTRYLQSLQAQSIARELHVSYTKLHRSFVHYVGHSMAKEIARRRVEHAARMLLTSKKKMLSIAWDSGFPDLSQMVKVFRRVKGTTPGAFRRAMSRTESQR